jgi:hypothetical protein
MTDPIFLGYFLLASPLLLLDRQVTPLSRVHFSLALMDLSSEPLIDFGCFSATVEDTSESFSAENGHSQPSSDVTTMDTSTITVPAGPALSFREKSTPITSPHFLACLSLLLIVRFLTPPQDTPFSLTLKGFLIRVLEGF